MESTDDADKAIIKSYPMRRAMVIQTHASNGLIKHSIKSIEALKMSNVMHESVLIE